MMPSTTLSWSTKHESTMSPLKFCTPPMVRSTDGNNNNIFFNSEQRGYKPFEIFGRLVTWKLPCDDCAFHQPGLILRWCDDCASAICDACILDHHTGHSITWYQEAVRSANHKYDDLLADANFKMRHLSIKRTKARRFQREIKTKIDDTKAKVQRREKEGGEMGAIMSRQLDELARLGGVVLNAKTICERRHTANAAKTLANGLLERQTAIVSQFKRISRIVSEMIGKTNQVEPVNKADQA